MTSNYWGTRIDFYMELMLTNFCQENCLAGRFPELQQVRKVIFWQDPTNSYSSNYIGTENEICCNVCLGFVFPASEKQIIEALQL